MTLLDLAAVVAPLPQDPQIVDIQPLLLQLAAALALAVVVERVVEVLKNVSDMIPTAPAARVVTPATRAVLQEARKAEKQKKKAGGSMVASFKGQLQRLESDLQRFEERPGQEATVGDEIKRLQDQIAAQKAIADDEGAKPAERSAARDRLVEAKQKLRDTLNKFEWDESVPPATVIVQEATDPDDGKIFRALIIQLVAVVVGIIGARIGGVRVFSAFPADLMSVTEATDYLLTGLLVAGGSAPIHLLLRFLAARKVQVSDTEEKVERQEEPVAALQPGETAGGVPGADASSDDWTEINYAGGVDSQQLQHVHLRRDNPSTIIFHHTAMHANSSFEDVVRVIKDKKDSHGNRWLTGYNCVVTRDGVIHPFCRWDRYGNHAAGHNAASLGISLNGNFDTDPAGRWSNPDGRYGPSTPSVKQLDAGARVVALWCLVYNIPGDFSQGKIIPHKDVSPKACPGSDFPYVEFERLVEHYWSTWRESPRVRARIVAFRKKPFVLVKPIPDDLVGGKTLTPAATTTPGG